MKDREGRKERMDGGITMSSKEGVSWLGRDGRRGALKSNGTIFSTRINNREGLKRLFFFEGLCLLTVGGVFCQGG